MDMAAIIKTSLQRRQGRAGRRVKGEAARRELDAAGRGRQDHPDVFSYPRGQPAKIKAAASLAKLFNL